MMSPNAGRDVLNLPSPVKNENISPILKNVAKLEAKQLLVRGGMLVQGVSSANPIGAFLNLASATTTLNAGEENFLQTNQSGSSIKNGPMYFDPQQYLDVQEAQRKTQEEIFQKQKREREERWSNMKVDELNTKLKTSDDHISRYFSRRAIK
jgi:hypothetical protein